MLKCEFGSVNIKGSKPLIKAELSTLIFALKQEDVLTDEDINDAVKSATETTEKDLNELSDKVTDTLQKILDILKED